MIKFSSTLLITAFLLNPIPSAYAQRILGTAAGGDAFFRADGKSALNGSLGRITSVALDPSGRPVFADPFFHLVLRVETDGTARVIAGNNIQGLGGAKANDGSLSGKSGGGFSGDGGAPTLASLNRPHGVAFDSAGNLYIADSGNNRIRKVDLQNNVITTFAGDGQARFGGDSGDPLRASLNNPISVAVDSAGNVFINDAGNYRIRKIAPNGNINTIAGTNVSADSPDGPNAAGSAINSVEGIATDAFGNLYIAEAGGNKIREVTSDGRLITIAGNGKHGYAGDGGPAARASLGAPSGVAVDGDNTVYIADTDNDAIRVVAQGSIATIAGNGSYGFQGDGSSASQAILWSPFGLAVSVSKELYIADRDNSRLRKIDTQGNIATVAGDGLLLSSGNGSPRLQVPLFDPFGVSLDPTGNLIITDTDNNVVRLSGADGSLKIIAGNGADQFDKDHAPALDSGLNSPFATTPDGDGFIIADTGNALVRRFTLGGQMDIIAGNGSFDPGSQGANPLEAGLEPVQTVVDGKGNIYVADFANSRIRKFTRNGTISTVEFGAGLNGVAGIALDDQGNLYATGYHSGRVLKYSPDLVNATLLAGNGQLSGAAANGKPATSVKLLGPAGIVVDAAQNVYFSDAPSNLVYQVTPDGIIHTVAGNGIGGYSGDGGLATSGSLNFPWGLAFDRKSATLYIADVLNNRIRTASPISATFAPSANSLSVSAKSNGTISDPVALDLIPSVRSLLYAASSSSPMLQITPVAGAMPARLQVQLDPTGLASGTYQQTITITASGAVPPTRTVNVQIKVAAEEAPKLSVSASVLSGSFVQGDTLTTKTISVANTGGGKLCYSAATSGGSSWLNPAASDCIAANQTGSVTVAIDPSQLDPSTYSDAVVIDAGAAGQASVPVNIVVNASLAKLQLSHSGITFTMVEGGGAPLPRTVGIVNVGQGSMAWRANKSTDLQLSQDWLALAGPMNGMVQQPYTDVSSLQLAIDPAQASQLATGAYYARVEVHADGNPTQSVTAVLNVLKAGTKQPPDVSSTALIFTGTSGQNPSSQVISLANVQSQPLDYQAVRVTNGQNWLIQTPTTGTLNPGEPLSMVVQPDYSNLNSDSGPYSGKITLQFSDGSSREVQVTALVADSGGATTSKGSAAKAASGDSCSESLTLMPGSAPPLAAVTGLSSNIEVYLLDGCQKPVAANTDLTVSVDFYGLPPATSEETSPLPLTNSQGKWNRSWAAKSKAPTRITAYVSAKGFNFSKSKVVNAHLMIPVDVQSTSASPLVKNGEVQNGASFQPNLPVAPGSYITLKGSNLGDAASSVPDGSNLPLSLGKTQVKLGDRFLPLSYAEGGQINAQIPYDVSVNDQFELSVSYGSAVSTADRITVAKAMPGIFTRHIDGSGQYVTGDGSGQGDIVNQANQLVDQTAPASANDVVNIICTGLGALQGAIGVGEVTSKPLATIATVTATIGGVPATVRSAALAVGAVGRYVVQAVVPTGVVPGPAVPVTITAAGQTSRAVTMAVK